MNVYFAHGKESGPRGTKIEALAAVARMKGFQVESPDYSGQPDPDARVDQLLSLRLPASDLTVLVGSSMGGYVSTVASQIINPVGLFLMAPAFYLPGYKEQNPVPHARKTVIIHGLKDDVVPAESSIRFAREHNAELHLLDSDHRLNDQLPKLEVLFDMFLDDVLELSDLPKKLTWEKIARKFGEEDYWVERIWEKMVSAGHADYRNEAERKDVLLRFSALVAFYFAFLSTFSRDRWGGPDDILTMLDVPEDFFDELLEDFVSRRGSESDDESTIQMALEEIAIFYVYPIVIEYFGDIEGVAASIYRASYPTFFDEDENEYISDPEDIDAEEISRERALQSILDWLEEKIVQ